MWLIPDLSIEKPTLISLSAISQTIPKNYVSIWFDGNVFFFFLLFFLFFQLGKRFESIVGNKKNYYWIHFWILFGRKTNTKLDRTHIIKNNSRQHRHVSIKRVLILISKKKKTHKTHNSRPIKTIKSGTLFMGICAYKVACVYRMQEKEKKKPSIHNIKW